MMPANEDCYEPTDEVVYEVWTTEDNCGAVTRDWAHTQPTLDEAESVMGVIEENYFSCLGNTLLAIDIYETTRKRVGGKTYEAPGEEAE